MAPPPPLTRSPSPALAGEAGGTLRPLAGFWFLNNASRNSETDAWLSFRPLAGFWFLNPRRARPCGIWMKMPFRGAEVLRERKAASVCLEICCMPRPISRGADSSPVHGILRKISRENTAGQSPRRIHVIYCALIESSMNLLPSFAFCRTSSVMSAPASTMTTPLSILIVRDAFLPSRKRR